MARTPEQKEQDPSILYAHKLGIHTIRLYFGPGIQVGWPDVLFLIPGGRPLFIEFKAPGKVPTPKQEKKIRVLKDAGYDVAWTDNRVEAKCIIWDAFRTAEMKAKH